MWENKIDSLKIILLKMKLAFYLLGGMMFV